MQIYTLQAFFKHAISQPHTGLEQFTVKFGYFPPPRPNSPLQNIRNIRDLDKVW